ncbi:glutamyl-tRNA reductase [Corynebacterium pseudopelargi]|uniref:glutamyl-tRNA reductase n=1 Tax=Corynebacterium pseudopelargi TaxID=2080757 RepID=UPI000F4E3D5E|nr:glutamyl-tRNA reductase [Corynebacterium pseudopelargi]
MSLLVVGMSHRSAPVALLEQLSLDEAGQKHAALAMVDRPSLSEAMIVSTCNRLEVYAVANSFHTGVGEVVEVLQEVSGADIEELRGSLYVRYADAAAEHMMLVSSGLDSMVIGEQQIIGQVRSSYQGAIESGSVGPALHGLVQAALRTGKRVHAETEIDEAGASMVSFAFDKALDAMGREDLSGSTGLVLGAGAMASLAATHMGRLGIDRIIVANRTRSRAERLAEHARQAGVQAEVVDFEQRHSVLDQVDIAVSATGADNFTITAEDIPAATSSLMLIDLSLPRDISDATAQLTGVQLVNIERLKEMNARTGTPTDAAAQAIVAEELEAYTSAQRVRNVAPAVSALRKHAAEIIDSEIERLVARTPDMDDHSFGEVQNTVRRVVDKLLHHPTVRVKELAASSGTVSYDTALQELFGLPLERGVSVAVSELPDAELVALGFTQADKVLRAE